MYINIPLQEGLDAFEETLNSREDKTIPTEFIMKLVKIIMEKNIFTFNNQHWLQLLGTSMGSRVSPTWANLFYGVLEKKILQNCPPHLKDFIFLWRRFITDIFIFFLLAAGINLKNSQLFEHHTHNNQIRQTLLQS